MEEIAAIEASTRAALPAVREEAVGDWMLRVSGGATKRVNSANPVRAGATLSSVLARAEAVYQGAGLPVRFRLTPLADGLVDTALAACGYELVDPSWTMTAPLDHAQADARVRVGAADATWRAAHAVASGWSNAERDAHAASLARRPSPAIAATAVDDGRAIGFAAASIAGGLVQICDVVVLPTARGRGIGRAITATLLEWARAAGATGAALQVLAANEPARRLYRGLGFVDAYPYHYRVRR